tara:strand:- start:37 stop:450 length:414 start_codon:yes stop_codon:yes gene_type:complete
MTTSHQTQKYAFVANLVVQTVDKKWEVLDIGKSIVSGKYYLLERRECQYVDTKPQGSSGTFPTWVMRKEVEKKNGKWTVGADYMITREMTPDGWRRTDQLRVIRYEEEEEGGIPFEHTSAIRQVNKELRLLCDSKNE